MTNVYLTRRQIDDLRRFGYEVTELREVGDDTVLCRLGYYALAALVEPVDDRKIGGLVLDAAALRLHIR